MEEDQAAAMAELSQAIAGDILSSPDLAGSDWDSCALVAEVSAAVITVTAYRYSGSGPARPIRGPVDYDLLQELWERTRGAHGEVWDIVIAKVQRDPAELVMDFVAGAAADRWRVTPATIDRLPELLRPRPEDFGA